MKRLFWLAILALAAPLGAAAQTKPATQEVKETVEELDPATGKVVRRTTRTYNVPAGTAASGTAASSTTSTTRVEESSTPTRAASDTAVSSFLREKVVVSTATAPQLLRLYNEFIETVRTERSGWKPADWERAAAVLSSLNARYEQTRSSFSLDDKLTIRSQQGEFQTLRTARQLSDQISNKL